MAICTGFDWIYFSTSDVNKNRTKIIFIINSIYQTDSGYMTGTVAVIVEDLKGPSVRWRKIHDTSFSAEEIDPDFLLSLLSFCYTLQNLLGS